MIHLVYRFHQVKQSRLQRPWSLPLARHAASRLHSNCSVSLNFLAQAPQHLFPILVSDSISSSRLDRVIQVIQIRLFSLMAVREFLPLLVRSCSTFHFHAVQPPHFLLPSVGVEPLPSCISELLRPAHGCCWCCTSAPRNLWCLPPSSMLV